MRTTSTSLTWLEIFFKIFDAHKAESFQQNKFDSFKLTSRLLIDGFCQFVFGKGAFLKHSWVPMTSDINVFLIPVITVHHEDQSLCILQTFQNLLIRTNV